MTSSRKFEFSKSLQIPVPNLQLEFAMVFDGIHFIQVETSHAHSAIYKSTLVIFFLELSTGMQNFPKHNSLSPLETNAHQKK